VNQLERTVNAIVELPRAGIVPAAGRMSASEVVQHALVVQEVMRAVMKKDVHFGVIPGTDKPTLYQPGADVLCMTFRIAAAFQVEDLSTADAIRYRVTCRGVHQQTGAELGSGIGEGSTGEEKYKWRKAVHEKEFEATPPNMRRIKYGRSYEVKQIRTEPADVANTVLKMAAKRAKIAMVLNVTAASDMFGQDMEDLDEALRESLTEDQRGAGFEQLRAECIAMAEAAKTEDELKAASKACVARFKAAKDTEGYGQFAAAVQKRGALLKAQAAAAQPPAPPPPEAAATTDSDAAWVAEMDAAEGQP
jgi:hypothetical protein